MSRFIAVAVLLAGCASAESADVGGEADLAVAVDAGVDLGAPAADLARAGDGGAGCPVAQHVVVNEVKTGTVAAASDEFIEIYNPCAMPVDLTGFDIVYHAAASNNESVVVTLTETIAGNGWLLLTASAYSNGGAPDQTYGTGKLAAAGGSVGLRDNHSVLLDSVGYGTATNALVEGAAAPVPADGQSIARIPNGVDTNRNNLDFSPATPTPRASN